MPNPYSNLVKLVSTVSLLAAPGGTTVKTIMAKLGLSKRSVFRLLEALGDLGRRAPRDVTPVREPEVTPELVDVRVDGDEEHRRGDGPEAQIDAVGRAHHPPEEQQQALDRGALRRIGEDVRRAAARG